MAIPGVLIFAVAQTMSSYIEQSLVDGETLLKSARISLWPYSHWIAFGALLLISPVFTGIGVISAGGVIILGSVFVMYESTELAVTNQRVVVKRGVMSRSTSELYLNRVEGVEVMQSVLGRILNYGTVNVRGVGDQVATVANVSGPMSFRNAFSNAANQMAQVPGKGGPAG